MSSLRPDETKSILEHFVDLKRRIFIALGAIIIGAVIANFFHEQIIAFLLRPLGDQHLIFLSPLEPLFFVLEIDCIAGVIITFPVVVWCIFSYIIPVLPARAKKFLVSFYISSTALLILSLWYAFFVMIPLSLKFLTSITVAGITNSFSVENYLSFYITQAVIIMAIFQVPILIVGGIYLGAFKTETLSSKRRYIYLFLTIALAIITPTTDIFSLCVVLIPCLMIFEISLIGGKIVEMIKKKRGKMPIET